MLKYPTDVHELGQQIYYNGVRPGRKVIYI